MDLAMSQTAFALVPITLLGSILNWCIFYSIHRLSSFNNSFGYLSANQAFTDALHSTAFLLYFCPMVLLDQPILKEYSHHCGFLVLFCYELSVMTHFAISLNRFAAAYAPIAYDRMFSLKKTRIIIVFLWVFTGSVAYLFYQHWCHLYYDTNIHFFTFTNTEFCGLIAWYGDFLKKTNVFLPTDSKRCQNITWYTDFVVNSTTVTIFMTLDLLTVAKVRQSRLTGNHDSSTVTKRERRFLTQTVFQGSLFVFELFVFFFVPKFTDNEVALFFSGTVAFVAIHMLDGVIVLACNPETRFYLFCRKQQKINTISVQHSVSKY